MLRDTPVKDIMVTNVVTVSVDEAFSHVEQKFRLNRIRHLPVLNKDNKLVGIITDKDLAKAVVPRETDSGFIYDQSQLDSFILKHYMTPSPVTLMPDSPVAEAVNIMATRKFGCIPIIFSDYTLAGIVTQIDILKFVHKWFRGEGKPS